MIRIVSGAAGYPILKTLRRGEQLRDARAVDVLARAAPVRTVTEVQPDVPAVRDFESLLTCCLFVKPTLDLLFKGNAPKLRPMNIEELILSGSYKRRWYSNVLDQNVYNYLIV